MCLLLVFLVSGVWALLWITLGFSLVLPTIVTFLALRDLMRKLGL